MLEIAELIISIGLIWYFFQLGADDIRYHIWAGALTGIAQICWKRRAIFEMGAAAPQACQQLPRLFHHSTLNMPWLATPGDLNHCHLVFAVNFKSTAR